MTQDIKDLIIANRDLHISTRTFSFRLYAMFNHIADNDIIFDEPSTTDMPLEALVAQAINCNILQQYLGYIDEFGHLHIVNAPNLQALLDVVKDLDNETGIPIMLIRRLRLATVNVTAIDWNIKDQDTTQQKENCAKVGIIRK